ncbi:bestrophin-4 [Drosophila bipectinata]|uniref:bestrophin-4 n=1 Tax=Drosophila bipectinata TaxID=42026 RepID=UPI001C8B041F|nr:bestrophin-4 [Drosophila bipectinata]
MTVSYTAEVATCRRFGCFWKLLIRWRASIYKIIWVDLLTFLTCFYFMAIVYRFALRECDRVIFEDIVMYCHSYGNMIPLSFVLGFYVSIIVERWWSQYTTVPWPDPLAVYVSALVRGQDEHGRLMRRTIMRYMCLALTMVLSMISPVIKRRFPTYEQLIEVGLLNANEANIIKAMDVKFPKHPKYWMPIIWASSIVTRARKEGRIWDDFSLKSMIDELNKFRSGCNMLTHYDMISVPLVYTQVVTLAVYTYFFAAIFGHQWIDRESTTANYQNMVNYYFPVFSTLEFFFFMGWLKVAETLICPFGDDDDDFELNWVIDRNLQVSYLIVDEMHNDHPQLVRDQYWDEVFPNELPYLVEAERAEHPEASTARLPLAKPHPHPSTTVAKSDETDWTDFDAEHEADNELKIRFAPRQFKFSNSSISISDSLGGDTIDMLDEEGDELGSQFSSQDDFELLKVEREKQRMDRQIQHAALTLELIRSELGSEGSASEASEASKKRGQEVQTDKSYTSQTKKDKDQEKDKDHEDKE